MSATFRWMKCCSLGCADPNWDVHALQDGVTGFHCGQIDPDGLVAADVDALAGAINRHAAGRPLSDTSMPP